jgi:sugar lactone lactonase YvrE
VYVVDADGGHARPVLQGQEHAVGPDFSADGKWIYYFSQGTGEGDIWRVPAEGGRPTRVTHVGANRPRMARDGEWMYFATPKGVFRAPVEGGKEELALSPAPPGMKWAVARDGLYFLSEESGRVEIRFKRFNERDSTLVGVIETPLYPFLEVSADGKSLLVTQIDRQGSDLMIINDFR